MNYLEDGPRQRGHGRGRHLRRCGRSDRRRMLRLELLRRRQLLLRSVRCIAGARLSLVLLLWRALLLRVRRCARLRLLCVVLLLLRCMLLLLLLLRGCSRGRLVLLLLRGGGDGGELLLETAETALKTKVYRNYGIYGNSS